MQSAMLLTRQKPIQTDRKGEVCEGLSGSTKSVGCVERSVRNLGDPSGSDWGEGSVARHTDLEPRKGKPGHRSRPEPTRHGQPPQPVSKAEQKRGALKTPRESDPPILLRDG